MQEKLQPTWEEPWSCLQIFTKLELTDGGKNSILLLNRIKNVRKKFYVTSTRKTKTCFKNDVEDEAALILPYSPTSSMVLHNLKALTETSLCLYPNPKKQGRKFLLRSRWNYSYNSSSLLLYWINIGHKNCMRLASARKKTVIKMMQAEAALSLPYSPTSSITYYRSKDIN